MNKSDRYRENLKLDLYGPLLTDTQRRIYQWYYGDDLSLGEIARRLRITRQGVYKSKRQAARILAVMEAKLGLSARAEQQRNLVRSLDRMTMPPSARGLLRKLEATL